MSQNPLRDIDFARHQRWLDRSMGDTTHFLVLDAEGEGIWQNGQSIPAGLPEALGKLSREQANSLHLIHLVDGLSVICRALLIASGDLLGWGCIQFDPRPFDPEPSRLDALAEAFTDMLDSLSEDLQHRAELDAMTEELGARYEELHLIYSVDQHIQTHGGDYQQIFQSLLDSTAQHLNVDVVSFVLPYERQSLHSTSLSQPIHNLDLVLVEMRGDLFRFVQAAGETLVLNSKDDPRRAYVFTDMPYKVLACPVMSGQKIDALIVFLNHAHKPDFTNSDRKLAEVLATQLSSLSSSYLLVSRLKDFNEQIARSLIEAVEAKDPYTRGHSDRVNFIALEIGKEMNLSAQELDELQWGSLLHDVGKIGIPDAILCKPSALTRDEYTFIKVHPERSYDILKHMKQLEMAATAARHHQEQFDGNGYPHGLRGERIPLLSRIIAVADTYDSITSSRAYRAGRTHETAMREIDRIMGTQLDPAIVKTFVGIVSQEPEWLRRFNIRREES
ncbi:MAG: HD domain-containing protein [Betaproteobacteria bacterium]|jgi:HD-GYP domain-containing protein (c-di-GMP phosphodiesterase class II)|nr:HD domain-containing protein [Betaproteobacteria bacterium]MBP7780129.1 HD domain-containing protein [Burkholderiaceae bacterium]